MASTHIDEHPNVIYIEPTEAICGTQTVLSVKMKNNVAIETIQFNLYLPDEVTIIANEDDELITASKERIKCYNYFESEMHADGALYLYALANTTNIPAGEGEICRVVVAVPENMEGGDYPIVFKDILMVENNDTGHSPDPIIVNCKLIVIPFTPGDANDDGTVDIADVTAIINRINGNVSANYNAAAADVSGDGQIDIADVTGIINIINSK